MVKSQEKFSKEVLSDNFEMKSLIVTVEGSGDKIEVHEDGQDKPDDLIFSVPENSKIILTFKYVVKHKPIKKLTYYQAIKKAGIPLKTRNEHISDYVEPNTPERPVYTHTFSPEDVPGGFFARGTHPASSHFYEEGKEFLVIHWHVDIAKKGSKAHLKS